MKWQKLRKGKPKQCPESGNGEGMSCLHAREYYTALDQREESYAKGLKRSPGDIWSEKSKVEKSACGMSS